MRCFESQNVALMTKQIQSRNPRSVTFYPINLQASNERIPLKTSSIGESQPVTIGADRRNE